MPFLNAALRANIAAISSVDMNEVERSQLHSDSISPLVCGVSTFRISMISAHDPNFLSASSIIGHRSPISTKPEQGQGNTR